MIIPVLCTYQCELELGARRSRQLSFLTMNVLVEHNNDNVQQRVVFLYRLVQGAASKPSQIHLNSWLLVVCLINHPACTVYEDFTKQAKMYQSMHSSVEDPRPRQYPSIILLALQAMQRPALESTVQSWQGFLGTSLSGPGRCVSWMTAMRRCNSRMG